MEGDSMRSTHLKVENMVSNKGNKIPNQFIIEEYLHQDGSPSYTVKRKTFQSYKSIIARITGDPMGPDYIELDKDYWNYSVTTSKYRRIFLGEGTKETEKKIQAGEYVLTCLNYGNG